MKGIERDVVSCLYEIVSSRSYDIQLDFSLAILLVVHKGVETQAARSITRPTNDKPINWKESFGWVCPLLCSNFLPMESSPFCPPIKLLPLGGQKGEDSMGRRVHH